MNTFEEEVSQRIRENGQNDLLNKTASNFIYESIISKYSYNFSWLGRPIIQYPQDIVAMQEIIWSVKPDLIIETGIAHGGSLIFSASMLCLNTFCGGPVNANVIGIDIDIREHNRIAIEAHPLSKFISMIQGSSISADVVSQVKLKAKSKKNVLVFLDSNHTGDHVLAELEAFAPLVSVGSYCIVFDTIIENLPKSAFPDRPWKQGNNPKTAVTKFLNIHSEFEIDKSIKNELIITVAPDGYLKRVR
jgi:cephalosporin hydroxylase